MVYFVARGKTAVNAALLEAERKARAEERERSAAQADTLKHEHANALARQKEETAQAMADVKAEHREALQQARQEAEERRARELGELQKRYDMLLQQFKAEVTTATEKLLKERSGELQQANTQRMDELFAPLKDNIRRMEQSMNANREATVQSQTRFEDAMKQMMESNERLGNEADRLSTALQRKNKLAGNWGELILTELLESQGLEAGVHFDVQKAYKDTETGATKIPDVVLHLADNRDVIVDSKMSLTAFVDYQNAEDDARRNDALARHLASVREHIKELTDKTYANAIAKPRVSAAFVIMFVPIEGALQLALSAEPSLWREAFSKKVFIAGGQTLAAALRIIDLTWVNVQQNRNTQNVMDEARKLIDRVCSFYEKFQDLGKKLGDAAKAYDIADQRVKTGSRSILALGNRLEELGARGKKALPRSDAAGDYTDGIEELADDE